MAKARFLYNNLWAGSGAIVTASSEATALPATNTRTSDRTAVWRSSTTGADKWVMVDLLSSQAITGVALANVRPHGAGGVKLQWSNDGSSGWTDIATLSAQDTQRLLTYSFFASVTKRYYRILFAAGAGSDYVEIGYVWIGTYLEPTINVSAPLDIQVVDPSVVVRSPDGQRTSATRTLYDVGRWEFQDVPEADMTSLRAMYRNNGPRLPVITVLDTTRAWAGWMAFLDGPLDHKPSVLAGRYNVGVSWEEAR